MVSVRWALRPSMVSVTLAMRWSTAATACAAPVVSDVVRWVRRESIELIACAVPSVSDDGEVGEARVEQVDRLRGAVGQRRGQRAETVVDGFGDRLRPRIEILFERFEAAVDQFVERLDACRRARVERAVERDRLRSCCRARYRDGRRGLPSVVSNCTRRWSSEAVIVAAVGAQAGVEGVDIGLQAVRDVLGALAHALDDLAAEGFDGAVEFRDVAGDQRAKRAAVAREFLRQFAALVLHQFVERAHLQGERCRARFRSG